MNNLEVVWNMVKYINIGASIIIRLKPGTAYVKLKRFKVDIVSIINCALNTG